MAKALGWTPWPILTNFELIVELVSTSALWRHSPQSVLLCAKLPCMTSIQHDPTFKELMHTTGKSCPKQLLLSILIKFLLILLACGTLFPSQSASNLLMSLWHNKLVKTQHQNQNGRTRHTFKVIPLLYLPVGEFTFLAKCASRTSWPHSLKEFCKND